MQEIKKRADIRAVIFDIDGTIVDSFEAYHRVFNEGISGFNVAPVSAKTLRDHLAKGLSLWEILQKVFPPPLEDRTYNACRQRIVTLFRKAEIDGVKSFPGTEALFCALKSKGIKIGIATGRTSSVEDEWFRFERLGLDRYIDAIVTTREVECRKPAPDAIIECARRLGVPTENCMVVGDTESDIAAAKSAGAIAVAVTTGHEDEEALVRAGPESVLRDLKGLIAYLESAS